MRKARCDWASSLPLKNTKPGNGNIGRCMIKFSDHCSLVASRGCVTPKQITGVKSSIEDNLDLFDGFDELPNDLQEKVKTALADGHIADDDWTGVPSVCSPTPPITLTSSRILK